MIFTNFLSQPTKFEKRLGYKFKNRPLFQQAFSHKSYVTELQTGEDNERLEFLGDSILGMVLSDLLMKKYPLANEGILSKVRSSLVSTKGLYKKALELGIGKELKLSLAEKLNQGVRKPRLLASALEAIIGALYLDAGFKKTKTIVIHLFEFELSKEWIDEDYKTILQGRTQKLFQKVPFYKLNRETGPPHKKTFHISVILNNNQLGKGIGYSKKEAEQQAAFEALTDLDYFKEKKQD